MLKKHRATRYICILFLLTLSSYIWSVPGTPVSRADTTMTLAIDTDGNASNVLTERRIIELERKMQLYNSDKELWSASLDRTNVLFAAFNTMILMVAGLGYFGLFRSLIKSVEKKASNRISELEYSQYINACLVYRTMYFCCIGNCQFCVAILWASRVIQKEAENPKPNEIDIVVIQGFIRNMGNLVDKHFGDNIPLNPEDVVEIIDNLQKTAQICKDKLDEDMYQRILDICSNLTNVIIAVNTGSPKAE